MVTHSSGRSREAGDRGVDESRIGELNELGSEGWELVAVVPVTSPDGFEGVTYVFKRPCEW
jgi:hypothetical protein